jgi:hypothetical protein
MAQAGGLQPDEDLTRLRLVEVQLDDLEVLADIPQHRGSRLHAHPPGKLRSSLAIFRLMVTQVTGGMQQAGPP